jgi:dehydrogenase/reductase SDR family member 12
MKPNLPVPSSLDRLLDTTVVLGFSKVGAALRPLGPPTTRMDGKRVVVTGATGGIGRAASIALAGLGAEVVLVGRNESKLDRVADEVVSAGGHAATEVADLSSMSEVVALSDRLNTRFRRIDVMVNNVGVLYPERIETSEGLEATLATNLAGQFILTNRLIEALKKAEDPARIITVSSGGMYTAKLSTHDLESTRSYKGSIAYARTKRAQVVLTEMWAERHANDGIVAHSMHPGWAATEGVSQSLPMFSRLTGPILRSPEQGADTIVWLAAEPDATESTGVFWHDRKPRPTHRVRSTIEARGERERLWQALERLQQRFETRSTHQTIK